VVITEAGLSSLESQAKRIASIRIFIL
jgi:hypothetical protein